MTRIDDIRRHLAERLPELVAKHGVPGAQIAVLADGEIATAASGVLNLGTGVEATTDSVCQIGSITKLWTATLVMQLVEEGLLDPDRPVGRYLPGWRLADADATEAITTRQLLGHTAGFLGDLIRDTGTGADAVEKYVATLGDAGQLFPPGERFSYNNAGYIVLGRLVEVLRGKPFNQALREHLITPLGLTHTATDATEAIRFRAAMGHLPGPDSAPVPAPVWSMAPSVAPAGALLSMRASDLLEFARLFLDGGRDGILSADGVAAMLEPYVAVPDVGRMPTHYGLGFGLWRLPGHTVVGHDGGTLGQSAFLRLVPGTGVAIALLANGGQPMALYEELVLPLLAELTGAELPAVPRPPAEPVAIDPVRAVGRYDMVLVHQEITVDEQGRCWLRHIPLTEEAKLLFPRDNREELLGLDADRLITRTEGPGGHTVLVLIGEPGQPARFLHSSRAAARV